MTENKTTARVITALVCDDVRREETGKEIIIGVYTGGILVEKFPAQLILCLWTLLQTSGAGELALNFRLLDSEDKAIISIQGAADIAQTDEPSSLTLPKFPVKIEKPTVLRFQLKHSGRDWETVAEKYIRLRTTRPGAAPSA